MKAETVNCPLLEWVQTEYGTRGTQTDRAAGLRRTGRTRFAGFRRKAARLARHGELIAALASGALTAFGWLLSELDWKTASVSVFWPPTRSAALPRPARGWRIRSGTGGSMWSC